MLQFESQLKGLINFINGADVKNGQIDDDGRVAAVAAHRRRIFAVKLIVGDDDVAVLFVRPIVAVGRPVASVLERDAGAVLAAELVLEALKSTFTRFGRRHSSAVGFRAT